MPIQSTVLQIPANMIQFLPTGQFKHWRSAAEAGAPTWVKHYLEYQNFNYDNGFKIVFNNVTMDYAIIATRS